MSWDREGITVVIPTIMPRHALLLRALSSVAKQTLMPTDVHIQYDLQKEGAAATRTKGLDAVKTRWVAFLDDDDELYPHHLKDCIYWGFDHRADLVYPWFDVKGGTDPFPQFEGVPWDPDEPHTFPITVVARTEVLQATGGFRPNKNGADEDWVMWQDLVKAGARIEHVDVRSWLWHHDSKNTSGMAKRW